MAANGSSEHKVALLIGTHKGAFIASSDETRRAWDVSDLMIPGADVFHLAYDSNTGRLLAAVNHPVYGPEIYLSHNFGESWQSTESPPRFPKDTGLTLQRVWHVLPGRPNEPGVVYLGVEPAALFRSEDGGDTWQDVRGLTEHSTRDMWFPGAGGLILHSIVLDHARPERMWVGISAAGVFRTEDAGESWQPANTNVRADFLPNRHPEVGQCPHKLLGFAEAPGLLYQQNHCGVYRSDSGGDHWEDISEGLPSRFGLPLAVHPRDTATAYVLPEDSATGDELGGAYRFVPDGRFRVFRTNDKGSHWEGLSNGLPQRKVYLHAMREALATDACDPAGVYVATTSGQIFHSADEGDSWDLLIDSLPPVNSVEVALID